MRNSAIKVAVVDEDLGVRRLLRRELTAAGFYVEDFTPGADALRHIANEPFDLLILNIDSPANGGPEAIRSVREHSPVPIVAVSAHSDEDAMAGSLDTGVDDWVRQAIRSERAAGAHPQRATPAGARTRQVGAHCHWRA